jgi:hypothetical protein
MADDRRKADDELNRVVQLTLENWDLIGVVEGDGIQHLPCPIKRRNSKGGLDDVETVWLRNITNEQRYKARVRSREWAAELKLDLARDADLVDQLENFEILAYAIRDSEWIQHYPRGVDIFKAYGPGELDQIWSRYDAWCRMLHPSFGSWDAEQLWTLIAKVRAHSDISPLAVMPGREQANCLLFMAREACCSPNAPSWLRSSVTLTRAL